MKILMSTLSVKVNKQLVMDSTHMDGNTQNKTKKHVLKFSHVSRQKGNRHFLLVRLNPRTGTH